MTHKGAFLLLVLSVMLCVTPCARAAESYDNCTGFITSVPAVISTQGTWCLKQDLSLAAGAFAITINANNVTIDCNDFKLVGLTPTTGIYGVDRLNNTVRHCDIRGFNTGVYFSASTSASGNHVIEDNRFDGNTFVALFVWGDGSVVRRNRVFNTGGAPSSPAISFVAGIVVRDNVDVLDNTVSGVTADPVVSREVYGIQTINNLNGSISGNRVRGLKDSPSDIYGVNAIWNSGSGKITLRNNDVVGAASTGSIGLHCENSTGIAKGNIVNGFVTGIGNCTDAGGNVVAP